MQHISFVSSLTLSRWRTRVVNTCIDDGDFIIANLEHQILIKNNKTCFMYIDNVAI